jgi:hypothetical protein
VGVSPAALAASSEKCRKERRARRNWARARYSASVTGPPLVPVWVDKANVTLRCGSRLVDGACLVVSAQA